MINHAEAQSLVSARLDEPLDPIVARELDIHLATCPQCRAFANQTAAMTQALHDLPRLPASQRVRREVLDAIEKPQTPWTRFQGILAPGPGSALSTVAAVLVVAILSIFVLTRFLGNDGKGNDQTNLLAPSVQTTREADVAQANPTATTAGNDAMTAPTETARTEPTPTSQDTQAANAVPTDVPLTEVPTSGSAPTEPASASGVTQEAPPTDAAPTATVPAPTSVPTEPATEGPTATAAGADTASGDSGSNAIRIAAGAATSPQAAAQEPTSTDIPTDVPTEAPTEPSIPTETSIPATTEAPTEPPTETPAPTEPPTQPAVPTETPAPTMPEPTPTQAGQSPPIESTTGTYEAPAQGDSTPKEHAGAPDSTGQPTPIDVTQVPPPAGGGPAIEPNATAAPAGSMPTIAPANETPGQDQTVPNDGTGGASTTIPQGSDVSTPDAGTATEDPGTSLGPVDPSTRIEASGGSWAPASTALAPQTSADGVTVAKDANGTLSACAADGSCQPIATGGSARTVATPVGWIGSTLIVAEQRGGSQATYQAITIGADGTAHEDVVLGSSGASTGTAYVFGDGLLIETETGWFRATASQGEDIPAFAAGSTRQQVRLYPALNRVVSLVDGSVLVESLDNGEVLGRVSTTVVDFDLNADGQQLVISTGSAIEIWNVGDSSRSMRYSPPSGDQIGSVAWSGDSILYVDATTGEVRIIAASDFGPQG